MAAPQEDEAREVFIVNLPLQITQHWIAEVLRKFGAVRRPVKIGTRDNRDGSYTKFALVEFQSPDSACLAVEARVVCFGEKVATIRYKKTAAAAGVSEVTNVIAPESGVDVFVACLPEEATKYMVAGVLRKFGPVVRQPNAVQLWTKENRNGSYTTNALVQFQSPDSARLAVEARVVKFGEKEATIEYNKPGSDFFET